MPVAGIDSFVNTAIDSVLAQRDVTVELILIGPTHCTHTDSELASWISQTYGNDSRLKLVARSEAGIGNALNTGLLAATGEYIARMDADDESHPDRLATQLQCALACNEPSLISACVEIFSDTDNIQAGNRRYQQWLNSLQQPATIKNACFIESPLPHPTWFAHRRVWKQIGVYRHGDFPEDYDFVLRAWLAGIPMTKPTATLLRWREHAHRLTRTDTRYRREAFTQLKAAALCDPRSGLGLQQGRSVWIAGTGRNARYWHDALEAQQAVVAGFVELDHAKAKQQKRHKPVITYQQLAADRSDELVVSAITEPSARNQLSQWFMEQQWQLGQDAVLGG